MVTITEGNHIYTTAREILRDIDAPIRRFPSIGEGVREKKLTIGSKIFLAAGYIAREGKGSDDIDISWIPNEKEAEMLTGEVDSFTFDSEGELFGITLLVNKGENNEYRKPISPSCGYILHSEVYPPRRPKGFRFSYVDSFIAYAKDAIIDWKAKSHIISSAISDRLDDLTRDLKETSFSSALEIKNLLLLRLSQLSIIRDHSRAITTRRLEDTHWVKIYDNAIMATVLPEVNFATFNLNREPVLNDRRKITGITPNTIPGTIFYCGIFSSTKMPVIYRVGHPVLGNACIEKLELRNAKDEIGVPQLALDYAPTDITYISNGAIQGYSFTKEEFDALLRRVNQKGIDALRSTAIMLVENMRYIKMKEQE